MAKSQSPPITRMPIESSNIKSIGYHENTRTLEIEFLKGPIWRYTPITPQAWVDFSKAKSKGTYFATHIRGNPRITATKMN